MNIPGPMARQHQSKILTCVLLLALAIGGCEKKPADSAANSKSAPPPTLRLTVIGDPAVAEAVRKVRGEWQAQSGGDLEVKELPALNGDPQKKDDEQEKLAADAVIYPINLLPTLAERRTIRPLSATWLTGDPLEAGDLLIDPNSVDYTWDGQSYAVPLGSTVLVLAYRTDLFARFGKQPPRTWDEYQSLATFFADRAKLSATEKNVADKTAGSKQPALNLPADWSGTLEPLAPLWCAKLLLARAAAYAKHRDYFSVLLDRETMAPLIAGPPFVKALGELVAAAKTAHVDLLQLTPTETLERLLAGQSAMAIGWPSASVPHSGNQKSTDTFVPVTFAELPGATAAYNLGHKAWEDRRADDQQQGEQQRVTLRNIAGLAGSVVRGSEHAEAAFGLLAWLSSRRWSTEIFSPSAAATMFRQSQFDEPAPWLPREIDRLAAKQYSDVLSAALRRRETLSMPRIPGQQEYLAALDQAVASAVAGKLSPQQALDEAATQWEKITERLGKSEQLEAYRHSLPSGH